MKIHIRTSAHFKQLTWSRCFPPLEKRDMTIKPHQHRRQESKYGLNPSGESYSTGLRVMSPCSHSAALSHLLSSCPWAVAGSEVTPVESLLMLWVPLRAGLWVQHLQLCAPYSFTARGFLESKFITAPCRAIPGDTFLTLVFDPTKRSHYYGQTSLYLAEAFNKVLSSFLPSKKGTAS